ncbi:mitochondrial glyco protein [Periconia macrospinosa]|uniref:Mitochondrial glyco protein n=1 Tax=Periconia macrospinosa TaxID=97972 RepID=A0A2V1DHP6_9PLEO|nr:mitochondrial glyco protein [Periconia macrospinosa]
MYALRNLARSTPRSVARFSSKATIRPQPSLFRTAALQPSWSQFTPRLTASFHVSAVKKQDSEVREELVAKLQSEISLEEEMKDSEELSTNIQEYIDNSAFKLEDKPGHQEVTLTRKFGDETIRVTFTTADLNSEMAGNEMTDSMYDNEIDDIDGQSGGANTKGAINQGNTRDGNIRVAPEDSLAPADREELADEFDEENQPSYPAHVNIRIDRPGKGALAIDATAQDGDFIIEDLWYFHSAELADPVSAEKDWQRRTLYTGPPFGNLDEDLQILLEKYLEERGVNTRMALFIPEYIDHKEQKEYVNWLESKYQTCLLHKACI